MISCPQCRKESVDEAVYCDSCGAELCDENARHAKELLTPFQAASGVSPASPLDPALLKIAVRPEADRRVVYPLLIGMGIAFVVCAVYGRILSLGFAIFAAKLIWELFSGEAHVTAVYYRGSRRPLKRTNRPIGYWSIVAFDAFIVILLSRMILRLHFKA